jgi:hypothetical protein
MAPDSDVPGPPDVDVPDDAVEDDEDVVTVHLSPEGAYALQQVLENVRAHRLYPYNYHPTPPDDVFDDREDLDDLRRGLWKNRLVRGVHEERHA